MIGRREARCSTSGDRGQLRYLTQHGPVPKSFATLNFAIWNPIREWLRRFDALRHVA